MRIRSVVATCVPVALLVLSACGGSAAPPRSTLVTTTEPGASSPPAGTAAQRVEATETEFAIALSRSDFAAGSYTFVVVNKGSASHDLAIAGPGVGEEKTPVLQGGGQGELTVTLQPGTYKLWCTVGNHRARGMETEVNVSG